MRILIAAVVCLLTCLPGHTFAHPGDGNTTIVVTVEILPDGTWVATIGMDGRALTHSVPPSLFSESQLERVAIAHVEDADPEQQRTELMTFYRELIEFRFAHSSGDSETVTGELVSIGPDPAIAGRDDLPDHRWGIMQIRGTVPSGATSVQVWCWPFIQPLFATVTIVQSDETITEHKELLIMQADGLTQSRPTLGTQQRRRSRANIITTTSANLHRLCDQRFCTRTPRWRRSCAVHDWHGIARPSMATAAPASHHVYHCAHPHDRPRCT